MSYNKAVIQYATPTTGTTVTVNAFDGPELVVFLEPAGLLATLTITLPSVNDGQSVVVSTSQAITALTLNGGTILGGLTTLAANGFGRWAFSATSTKWFRLN